MERIGIRRRTFWICKQIKAMFVYGHWRLTATTIRRKEEGRSRERELKRLIKNVFPVVLDSSYVYLNGATYR